MPEGKALLHLEKETGLVVCYLSYWQLDGRDD